MPTPALSNRPLSLQDRCRNRILECFAIAEKHYGKPIPHCPVVFNNRLTKCAGKARSSWAGAPVGIQLSTSILNLNPEEFIARTPGHEAAHIITAVIYGPSHGHDYRWAEVMRLIGQKAERCHSMETIATKDAVVCICKCREHKITKRKALRVHLLSCKSCKSPLKVKGSVMNTATAKPVATTVPVQTLPKVTLTPKVKKVKVDVPVAKCVGKFNRDWATTEVGKGQSFARVLRVVVKGTTLQFDELLALCTEMEEKRNKAKVRSYLRHIILKELKLTDRGI